MAKSPNQNDLVLCGSEDGEGFSTLDLLQGLRGVCFAADQLTNIPPEMEVVNSMQQLMMAAKVLSWMLAERVRF